MKRKTKIIGILAILFIFNMFLTYNRTLAATIGSFSISAANSIEQGNTTTLTISVSKCEGQFSISSSNPNVVKVSKSSDWVSGSTPITLTGISSGTATISVTAVNVGDNQPVSEDVMGTKTVNITVKAKNSGDLSTSSNSETTPTTQTKSNNANLSNLGIKPNDFSGFSASKTSYSVTVPNDVESVEVYASKGQSGQTISGTGKISLKEGNNAATVKVTAEDGKTTKSYTINIERKSSTDEATEENETNNEEENATEETPFGLSNLEVKGLEISPEFKTDVYEYTTKLVGDKNKIDISAEPTEEGSKVEITGNEDLKDGENIVTIVVTDATGEKTLTYQIIVNKDSEEEITGTTTDNNENKKMLILVGCGALILVVIVVIVIIVIKKKKQNNDEYDYDYEMPFSNLKNDEDKIEEEQNNEEEQTITDYDYDYEEEENVKKKRHSKGKRFK